MGEEKKGFFKRLVSGLTKTRDNIVSGMDSIFHGFSKIDDDFYGLASVAAKVVFPTPPLPVTAIFILRLPPFITF